MDHKHNEAFVRNVFIPYFTDIFRDLAQQTELCTTKDGKKDEVTHQSSPLAEDGEEPGINKMIFLQYVYPLPLLLGQRLF